MIGLVIMASVPTVWVLGAGFSRPLGGPLLNELFRPRSLREFYQIYPDADYSGDLAASLWQVVRVFNDGRRAHLWAHAEQFLEMIEIAAEAKTPDRHVLAFLTHGVRMGEPGAPDSQGPLKITASIGTLAQWSRWALAADCGRFLRTASTAYETWEPYRLWAQQLDEDHTVITFNYDLVLERLKEVKDVRLTVALPR